MTSQPTIHIRPAKEKDCAEILQLMLQLAEFEGYADNFLVTEKELRSRLFTKGDFSVLVATHNKKPVGILVHYQLPFTCDLKPWIYIKELFIDSKFRGMNIGKRLMVSLADYCAGIGCTKIRWDVLSSNKAAQRFYQSLGGQKEDSWTLYCMQKRKIHELSRV